MSDFSGSAARLEMEVRRACDGESEWPARVAAGIHAALGFAVRNPEAARSLSVDFRAADFEHGYLPMIEQFSSLLRAEAPPEVRLSASTEQALVGGIATIVADHVRSGRLDRLGELAPELIYLTLLPYLGFQDAKQWADSLAPPI